MRFLELLFERLRNQRRNGLRWCYRVSSWLTLGPWAEASACCQAVAYRQS